MTHTCTITDRQMATVLAALRLWQETTNAVEEMPEFFTEHKPLSADEIDVLCESLNTEG